jgi:hypothetical protein
MSQQLKRKWILGYHLIEEAKQRSNIAFEEMKESLINSGLDEQSPLTTQDD